MDMSFAENVIISVVISSVVGAAWLFMDTSFYTLYSKLKKHNEDIKTMQRIIKYLRENSNEKIAIFKLLSSFVVKTTLCCFIS